MVETIENINKSEDINHLVNIQNNANYYIELLTSRDNINYIQILIKEANKYGVASLDEYIKIKSTYYLSLREASINRLIELNSDTTRRSGTSSVVI